MSSTISPSNNEAEELRSRISTLEDALKGALLRLTELEGGDNNSHHGNSRDNPVALDGLELSRAVIEDEQVDEPKEVTAVEAGRQIGLFDSPVFGLEALYEHWGDSVYKYQFSFNYRDCCKGILMQLFQIAIFLVIGWSAVDEEHREYKEDVPGGAWLYIFLHFLNIMIANVFLFNEILDCHLVSAPLGRSYARLQKLDFDTVKYATELHKENPSLSRDLCDGYSCWVARFRGSWNTRGWGIFMLTFIRVLSGMYATLELLSYQSLEPLDFFMNALAVTFVNDLDEAFFTLVNNAQRFSDECFVQRRALLHAKIPNDGDTTTREQEERYQAAVYSGFMTLSLMVFYAAGATSVYLLPPETLHKPCTIETHACGDGFLDYLFYFGNKHCCGECGPELEDFEGSCYKLGSHPLMHSTDPVSSSSGAHDIEKIFTTSEASSRLLLSITFVFFIAWSYYLVRGENPFFNFNHLR
jgi:hypothetical protein